MIPIIDKILYHFVPGQLLTIFLQHIQFLQLLNQLLMFQLVVINFPIVYFVLIEPLLTNLQIHTVESDHHGFTPHLGFDRVQGGNQIQKILLKGEEKDIRVQSEFESPSDDNIAIVPGNPLIFVICKLDPYQPVRIGSAGADILPHIDDKIILERYFQIGCDHLMHMFCKTLYLLFVLSSFVFP